MDRGSPVADRDRRAARCGVGVGAVVRPDGFASGGEGREGIDGRGAAGHDDLYERLKSNDFKHVEDAMNAIGDRIDRMDVRTEARLKRMETRILEAVRGRPDALAQPTSPGPEITGGLGFDENEDPES